MLDGDIYSIWYLVACHGWMVAIVESEMHCMELVVLLYDEDERDCLVIFEYNHVMFLSCHVVGNNSLIVFFQFMMLI